MLIDPYSNTKEIVLRETNSNDKQVTLYEVIKLVNFFPQDTSSFLSLTEIKALHSKNKGVNVTVVSPTVQV